MPNSDVTDDAVLGGRLRLLQPRKGHRVGHDAILLAAATPAQPHDWVVDLGAGVGAAGLAVAVRVPGVFITLVEIDPSLAALAIENANRNGFSERAKVIACDVAAPRDQLVGAGLAPASTNAVLMNPPFNDPSTQMASPDPQRRAAHVGQSGLLTGWVKTAAWLLQPGGTLTTIFHADRVAELLLSLEVAYGAIRVLPIRGRPDRPPIRVIARAVKGGPGSRVTLPDLVLAGVDGKPSEAADAVLRQGAALMLDR
jgi:tRNA1(Val) A37 N6-methylase TrmN6